MKPKHPVLFVALFLMGVFAFAQEAVTVRAQDINLSVIGEFISYNPDGTCTSYVNVRNAATAPDPLATTECNQSRGRARVRIGRALDAGTLFP